MLEELNGQCPYCGETLWLELDLSVEEQTYVEDCSVCCRPMVVHYWTDEHGHPALDLRSESE